jgi:hypothetical protein
LADSSSNSASYASATSPLYLSSGSNDFAILTIFLALSSIYLSFLAVLASYFGASPIESDETASESETPAAEPVFLIFSSTLATS